MMVFSVFLGAICGAWAVRDASARKCGQAHVGAILAALVAGLIGFAAAEDFIAIAFASLPQAAAVAIVWAVMAGAVYVAGRFFLLFIRAGRNA